MLFALGMFLPFLAESAAEPRLLSGEFWPTMSRNTTIASTWGLSNLPELERTGLGQQPLQPAAAEPKHSISYLVRGLTPPTSDEIVNRVDGYGTTHPAQRGRPVINAVFRSIVLPWLKAERTAGRNRCNTRGFALYP